MAAYAILCCVLDGWYGNWYYFYMGYVSEMWILRDLQGIQAQEETVYNLRKRSKG